MRILVVDHNIEVAVLLAETLRGDGHQVLVAHDGEEALTFLAWFRPDAVFLNALVGDVSGAEVLRRIRREDATVPVLLITGVPGSKDVETARALGPTDVLVKPFVLDRLGAAMATLRYRARGRPLAKPGRSRSATKGLPGDLGPRGMAASSGLDRRD